MSQSIYTQKFNDKTPVGGIGTGHIFISRDGVISGLPLGECFFVAKAKSKGVDYGSRLIQSTKKDGLCLDCFEKSDAERAFPFCRISLSDTNFPADIKLCSFSPFIPLNDTDSGIPAAIFEFEITNKTQNDIDFSLCLTAKNKSSRPTNKMGCTQTGEAYIILSGGDGANDNISIATNGKNVEFFEHFESLTDFADVFCGGREYSCNGGSLCSLSNSFSIEKGRTVKVIFCLSWYFPYAEVGNRISKNYYSQYFESSIEACSYVFRQMDRLKNSSLEFCENVFGADTERSAKDEICSELLSLYTKNLHRTADGTLLYFDENFGENGLENALLYPTALANLFPELDFSYAKHLFKKELYDKAGTKLLYSVILKCYARYLLTDNLDDLIENWYDITKCLACLYGDDISESVSFTQRDRQIFEAASRMAYIVKDKKRYELYEELCGKVAPQSECSEIHGFSLLYKASGFYYNAAQKHIAFSPVQTADTCDGTFRCFFCTPTCYGYVEEGIDYIEINLLCGSLTLRSFGVPRTPRLVQYGGRNWKFRDENLTAILDSDLEITPRKKLTVFIDIKQ